MKIRLICWLIVIFGGLVSAHCALAGSEGANSGGGGDGYAVQFMQIGYRIVAGLQGAPEPKRNGIDPQTLRQTILATTVQSTAEALVLNGASVDAINYPREMRIVVSRPSWRILDASQRETLVLHEYLGIMGIEDSHYQVSEAVIPELHGSIPGNYVTQTELMNFLEQEMPSGTTKGTDGCIVETDADWATPTFGIQIMNASYKWGVFSVPPSPGTYYIRRWQDGFSIQVDKVIDIPSHNGQSALHVWQRQEISKMGNLYRLVFEAQPSLGIGQNGQFSCELPGSGS